MKKTPKKKVVQVLKFTVSGLLVGILLWKIDVPTVWETLKGVDLWLYFLVFCIFLFNQFISAVRWRSLLKAQGLDIPLMRLYRLYLFGFLFNFLLPSSVGGDTVKAYLLVKDQKKKNTSGVIVATAFDRILGLVAILFMVAVTVPFNTYISISWRTGIAVGSLLCAGIACVLFIKTGWATWISRKIEHRGKIGTKAASLLESMAAYKEHKKTLSLSLLLSLLFHVIRVFNQFITLLALGIHVPLLFLFIAIPIETFITMIPISVGGIGLKEMTLIEILQQVGITATEVVSYTVLGYSFLGVLLLLFGISFLKRKILQQDTSL